MRSAMHTEPRCTAGSLAKQALEKSPLQVVEKSSPELPYDSLSEAKADRIRELSRATFDAQLKRLLPTGAGFKFAGDDFRKLCGPQVYLYMLRGYALYVGMSGNGLERSASPRHQQADRARAECDEILIYPCSDRNTAHELEGILIHTLRPLFNYNGK